MLCFPAFFEVGHGNSLLLTSAAAAFLLFANCGLPFPIAGNPVETLRQVASHRGGSGRRFHAVSGGYGSDIDVNLKSFAEGTPRDVQVTSWSGTLATSAREISLKEVEIGGTKLIGLKLPAIDLSAVGNACGRKIDGILGVDLLKRLGATIDMKRQMVHVATASEAHGDALTVEMQKEMHRCLEAFNNSDEKTFAGCLDPKIVLFSMDAELYGREQAVGYFRERYFHQTPAAHLEIHESAFHPIGEAIWYEYEFTIESVRGVLHGRGMAMCRKTEGRWRMASMHHSVIEMDSKQAGK